MNSVPATGSFEDRREVMRKVEHMVAEAEALNKTRDLRREEVHVSDASSSESEGEFPDIPNISPILNIGCDNLSQESSKPRPQNSSRSRRKIIPRLALTDEIELEALSAPQSLSHTGIQRALPQDKPPNGSILSTAKLDRSVASTSKSSTSTPSRPNDTLTKGGPINSFSTVKLDRPRSVVSKISSVNSNATPLTFYRGVPVNSPPFSVDSPAVATPESNVELPSSSSRKKLLNMKQEIDDLTAQFETLEKRSKQRNTNTNSSCKKTNFKNAEKAFEEGVDIMGKKTDAIIDALHRNLSNSQTLNRENDRLRGHVHNLSKNKKGVSPATPQNKGERVDENQTPLLGPEQTVDHFDKSNEYLKRRYPAVPTTPGTLFVSEIVEVLNLDVGEHTYLSDIMNRQWGTPDCIHS